MLSDGYVTEQKKSLAYRLVNELISDGLVSFRQKKLENGESEMFISLDVWDAYSADLVKLGDGDGEDIRDFRRRTDKGKR
jgi:hypothetical protein